MFDVAKTRVPVPGTTNVRDLGGFPARDGRTVQPHRLYRGETLASPGASSRVAVWADEHVAAYRALALRTVIDLRAVTEAELAPSVWHTASGARLVALSINEGGEGDATDYVRRLKAGTLRSFSAADLADYYAITVRRRATVLGQAITELADPGHLPALVHCSAGKDRTGLLVALVLSALGTPRELVVADYALTGQLRPDRVAAYSDILSANGIEPAAVSALFDAPKDTMTALLAGLDAEFGSIEGFLIAQAGITPATLTNLAEALLHPSPSTV